MQKIPGSSDGSNYGAQTLTGERKNSYGKFVRMVFSLMREPLNLGKEMDIANLVRV